MDEPIEHNSYVGLSMGTAAISLLLGVAIGVGLLVGLLYLRMGDVTSALQQQAVSCAEGAK